MSFPSRRQLQRIATGGVCLFLAIAVAEHLINTSLDPTRHEISEYVHAKAGWLMTVGFVSWGISLAATSRLVSTRYADRPASICLTLASLGLVVAACFATQTSAGRLPPGVSLNATGQLHDIGSGIATLSILASALLSLRGRYPQSVRIGGAALAVMAISADIALLAVGEVGGIRQRLLVIAGCLWQLLVLGTANVPRVTPERQAPADS
jgi:hypothetical protein